MEIWEVEWMVQCQEQWNKIPDTSLLALKTLSGCLFSQLENMGIHPMGTLNSVHEFLKCTPERETWSECRQAPGLAFPCASAPWATLKMISCPSSKPVSRDRRKYVSNFAHIWKEFFLEDYVSTLQSIMVLSVSQISYYFIYIWKVRILSFDMRKISCENNG